MSNPEQLEHLYQESQALIGRLTMLEDYGWTKTTTIGNLSTYQKDKQSLIINEHYDYDYYDYYDDYDAWPPQLASYDFILNPQAKSVVLTIST